jgi:hydroxypyruvate isomerase
MLKFAANISMLFREMELLERFSAVRTAGFDDVDCSFPTIPTI